MDSGGPKLGGRVVSESSGEQCLTTGNQAHKRPEAQPECSKARIAVLTEP